MSLFFIDNRPAVDEIKACLRRYSDHRKLERLELELQEPVSTIRIDREGFTGQLLKLAAYGNEKRAEKLAEVIAAPNPRLWWLIPLRLVLWPFVFVWRVIKLGIP